METEEKEFINFFDYSSLEGKVLPLLSDNRKQLRIVLELKFTDENSGKANAPKKEVIINFDFEKVFNMKQPFVQHSEKYDEKVFLHTLISSRFNLEPNLKKSLRYIVSNSISKSVEENISNVKFIKAELAPLSNKIG